MKFNRSTMNKVMKEVFGQDVLPVTAMLNNCEEISEIKLADQLKIEVNEARRTLYKLYQENLVTFKKKKDLEHGWYTYYWSFNHQRIGSMLQKTMNSRLEILRNRLEAEKENQYFSCCLRMDITTAMAYNFKCPECGSVMKHEDNRERIVKLKENIRDIKDFMKIYS